MHVISKKLFMEAMKSCPAESDAILRTYFILEKGTFNSSSAMKQAFSSLDRFKEVKDWWVIDIAGNTLRLIAFINFSDNRLYAKYIVTHSEYDKLCKKYRSGGH